MIRRVLTRRGFLAPNRIHAPVGLEPSHCSTLHAGFRPRDCFGSALGPIYCPRAVRTHEGFLHELRAHLVYVSAVIRVSFGGIQSVLDFRNKLSMQVVDSLVRRRPSAPVGRFRRLVDVYQDVDDRLPNTAKSRGLPCALLVCMNIREKQPALVDLAPEDREKGASVSIEFDVTAVVRQQLGELPRYVDGPLCPYPDPTSGVGGHANREICGLTCVNAG